MASPLQAQTSFMSEQSELDHEDFETSVRSNLTNAAVKQLLTDHMVMISQNVNISNLKPYLIEHRCISMDDDQPTDSTELAKIISRGGVGAFDSFIDALEHSVREEPGERGHQDLADTLIEAARTRRRSSTASSYTLSRQVSGASNASLRKPSLPIGPPALLPATKVSPVLEEEPRPYMDDEVDRDCHVDIDGPTAPPQISDTNPEPSTEHPFETTGPSPQPQEQVPVESVRNEIDTGILTAESNPDDGRRRPSLSPRVPKWLLRFGSIGIIAVSPLLLIIGITLLAFSIEEFTGKPDCDVGAPYSLSVFNLLFGLLCLSIPGLLIMFILYFRFEDPNTRWERKLRIHKCLVWLTLVFFLICFVLAIGELLFSLLYVAQEVYDQYSRWHELRSTNMTICHGSVYVSSFSIITVSYTIVFLVLVGLGVISAKLYFKWIIDPKHPGTLRKILRICLDAEANHEDNTG